MSVLISLSLSFRALFTFTLGYLPLLFLSVYFHICNSLSVWAPLDYSLYPHFWSILSKSIMYDWIQKRAAFNLRWCIEAGIWLNHYCDNRHLWKRPHAWKWDLYGCDKPIRMPELFEFDELENYTLVDCSLSTNFAFSRIYWRFFVCARACVCVENTEWDSKNIERDCFVCLQTQKLLHTK